MKVSCEISGRAALDLEDIFDYTLAEFGLDQAVTYLSAFDDVFARLSDNPKIGRERSGIKKGLHSVIDGEHVVFYRMIKTDVRIVRILHGIRDLPRMF
ncbi:MAG: type II toxin-antitoxin system RelE/ParE family toxin [Bacteroidetes bacterium]|nr:type II toxin-antitoxin system RelE/ParE family toxin [Bacteroidota bacterium]